RINISGCHHRRTVVPNLQMLAGNIATKKARPAGMRDVLLGWKPVCSWRAAVYLLADLLGSNFPFSNALSPKTFSSCSSAAIFSALPLQLPQQNLTSAPLTV